MRKDMQLELKEMHKKLGITFIYVTHDQEEALTLSDTIVVMKDGMIQQIGTPEGIYNEPANAFVADFIGESNIYSGTMIDRLKVRFLGHVFDALDEFDKNEKVDVVVRPEDVKLVPPGQGMLDGKLIDKIFKGIHYEYTLMVGHTEVIIQDTRNMEVNCDAGIIIEPDGIHIMKKEFTANIYDDAYIDKNNNVVISDFAFPCDVTKLVPGSTLDGDGYVIGPDGTVYDFTDADVKVTIGLGDIEIMDNIDESTAWGNIVENIYKGDHYMVTVRTQQDEDFILDTVYTYDAGDQVGIRVKPELISLALKGEAKKYAKK